MCMWLKEGQSADLRPGQPADSLLCIQLANLTQGGLLKLLWPVNSCCFLCLEAHERAWRCALPAVDFPFRHLEGQELTEQSYTETPCKLESKFVSSGPDSRAKLRWHSQRMMLPWYSSTRSYWCLASPAQTCPGPSNLSQSIAGYSDWISLLSSLLTADWSWREESLK